MYFNFDNIRLLSIFFTHVSGSLFSLWTSRWSKVSSLFFFADALTKTSYESIGAILLRTHIYDILNKYCKDVSREFDELRVNTHLAILFAGFVTRMGEERLPQRVMFREFVRGKCFSGGQEKDWMDHLKEVMSVFGMKFEGWRKAAQKAGRWFRRVEEGTKLFMRNWHETERRKAAERRERLRQRHPPLASLSGRGKGRGIGGAGGRGGTGGVMPKRLKSGFGHYRIESCGPSNGRHRSRLR